MNDIPTDKPHHPKDDEALGVPERMPDPPVLQVGPEMAVAEDVHEVVTGELVAGSSLWRDAWRRLLRNKLAVFGIVIVLLVTVASLIGPSIIKARTGYAYDYIPKDNRSEEHTSELQSRLHLV